MIATEVATEKSSRVMEILISSVSPVKHMFAKVAGMGRLVYADGIIGTCGLYCIEVDRFRNGGWFLLGLRLFEYECGDYRLCDSFFLLGYFLFATLAALLRSLVSRTEDVQANDDADDVADCRRVLDSCVRFKQSRNGLYQIRLLLPVFRTTCYVPACRDAGTATLGAASIHCYHAPDNLHPRLVRSPCLPRRRS